MIAVWASPPLGYRLECLACPEGISGYVYTLTEARAVAAYHQRETGHLVAIFTHHEPVPVTLQ